MAYITRAFQKVPSHLATLCKACFLLEGGMLWEGVCCRKGYVVGRKYVVGWGMLWDGVCCGKGML